MKRLLALLLLAPTGQVAALTIDLNYTYDSFFASNATARATLEAAAADLSAIIGPTLGAVSTDTFTGTNGPSSTTANWSLSFENPSTGATVTLNTFNFAADHFTIYVGMRAIAGSTLGEGGPGGAGLGLSGSGFEASWNGAVTNMQNASNAVMKRGGGPVSGSISGSFPLGAASGPYSLEYGAMIGNLWFDNDSDNNGAADSAGVLANYWHFDLQTPVVAGKNDFYSVALHEMMHSLGIGTSETWDTLRSGNNWFGPQALALNGGTGTNLLSGGSHILSGKMSPRLSDGVMQEVAMDPTLTTGTRKFLTELDAAFLRDLGYATFTPAPEPTSVALLAFGALALAFRRR